MANTKNEQHQHEDRFETLLRYNQHKRRPRIAILAALSQELEALQHLPDDRIVVEATGVGKVAAAVCTQKVISAFYPQLIISVGTAGALDDRLQVGDVGIVTAAIDADVDVRAWDAKYRRGQLPFTKHRFYRSSKFLVEDARQFAPNSFDAYVASGSAFLDDEGKAKFRVHLSELEDAGGSVRLPNLYDMETSAIFQAAERCSIPYLAVRVVSDTTAGDASGQFNKFLEKSSKKYAKVVEQLIDHYNATWG